MLLKKTRIPLRGATSLLLIVCLLASGFRSYAQNEAFVINLQNASIKEVMRSIKKQSGYSFLYSEDLIANYGTRDFNIAANRIEDVMDQLLSGTDLAFRLEDNVIVLVKASAPPKPKPMAFAPITGVVKDNTGLPLPGVNVVIKGTGKGTVTDSDGKYTLDVKEGETLVFSFIGYAPVEMPVNGQTTVDITLEQDVAQLGEVVVTGYQDIRKESFTGRVVTVSGADLKKVNPVNIFQSIQAYDPSFRLVDNNFAGSNPNRLPEINVRGTTGIPSDATQINRGNLSNNPNLPTFILDGFEVQMQTVYDLDVNRIASVTLLKDAAATAIYGSRAANGVLVITTKTPEEGKLQFSYNYELTASTPDLRVYDVLNASEKLEYEYLAGVYDSDRNANVMPQDQYDVLYYAKKRQVLSGVDSYWLSEPVTTAVGHKNSLTIEGGSKAFRYGVTGQYQTLPGVMKDSQRKRLSGDVYLSVNLNDKFIFRNTLSVSEVNSQESPYGSFANYVRMNPYYAKRDSAGNVLRILDTWKRRGVNEGGSEYIADDDVLNPLYDARLSSFDRQKYTQIINSFAATWNITQRLMMKGLISATKYASTHDIFISPLANRYYNYSSADLNKRGDYFFGQSDQLTIDGNIILSYNTNIDRHVINASIGANVKDFSSDSKEFWARGFTNDKFTNIGFASRYYENDSPTGLDETDRLVGSLLAVNYSYDDRFLLDVNARLDGSSKFGSDKKYAPFWAAGLGWNIHKESFLSSASYINQLRITGSTGVTGGVSFPPYLGKTTYAYFLDWYSTGVGASYMAYGNDNLTWQQTRNYDIGADVMLFNNRITFSPTYYNKLTKDLIQDIAVPSSLGYSSFKANLGEMLNEGYELALKVEVVRNSSWNVSLNGTFTRNTNTLRNLSDGTSKFNQDAEQNQNTDAYKAVPLLRLQEGQSLNTIYAVPSRGIDPESGKEIYVKRDGSLTYEYDIKDVTPVGNSTPKLYGFFGGTASYKSLMLYVSFYTRFGGDMYNQTLIDRVENANPRYNVDTRVLEGRWRQPGDVSFYKDIAELGSTRATSRFVQADNVVELKSVSLSYDVAPSFRKKLGMQMLRVVLTTNDAWRWSAVKLERGIEYPFARSFTLSVQSRF